MKKKTIRYIHSTTNEVRGLGVMKCGDTRELDADLADKILQSPQFEEVKPTDAKATVKPKD